MISSTRCTRVARGLVDPRVSL